MVSVSIYEDSYKELKKLADKLGTTITDIIDCLLEFRDELTDEYVMKYEDDLK